MTQENLDAKREQLDELEKSEREARRLEEALGRGRVTGYGGARREEDGSAPEEADGEENSEPRPEPESSYLPPHPGPSPLRRRAPGMGFLNALSYTLHGMMDVDPATARRNGITKSRETISQVRIRGSCVRESDQLSLQLEDALHLSAQDLKYASSTIQADLDRFQRQKVADIREMTIAMAKSHRDWCKKVCMKLSTLARFYNSICRT